MPAAAAALRSLLALAPRRLPTLCSSALPSSASLLRLRHPSMDPQPPAGSGPAAQGRTATTAAAASVPAAARSYRGLVYDTPGEPLDALRLRELPAEAEAPAEGQVELHFLQAPINPSDVNTVQGKYPLQPPHRVPGHEGVARVARVGPQVSGLSPGDWVVPLQAAQGTWRSGGLFAAADWHAVPQDIGLAAAATMVINPPTAIAMLQNFETLAPGDTVAQNGATSAVGEAVIQIARSRGIRTINIIRDRPDMEATVSRLKAFGADLVTTEERLKEDLKASGLPAPRLGLNCVGGSAALAVTKILQDGGTLVTYGGMSMQPLTAPVASLIFKDIAFRGFWLSGRWAKAQGPSGRAAVLDKVVELYRSGTLQPPVVQTFPLGRWREAFEALATPHRGRKVLLDCQAEDGV